MDVALLIARVVLAAVFTVSGLAKLADRGGSRRGVENFGLPGALAAPIGLLLPLVELAVAVALLPVATAWWGAIGALVLLFVFIIAIGANLALGRQPDCRCFGQLHSGPVGASTLIRNGVLAALAAFVVLQGPAGAGASAVGWLGAMSGGELLALLGGLVVVGLLVVEGWLMVEMLRQNGRLMLRIDALEQRVTGGGEAAEPTGPGLPYGSQAPDFSLPDLDGGTVSLGDLRADGKPILLVFTDPTCKPCGELMPDLGRWEQERGDQLLVATLSRGSREANLAKAQEHGLSRILLQKDYEIADLYQADGTPAAVVVRPDGTIGSTVALGPDQIRTLAANPLPPRGTVPIPLVAHPSAGQNGHAGHDHAGHDHAEPRGPAIGQDAPPLKLADLDGAQVELADFRGDRTLVVFWNPGCGFCKKLLPDLKAWEANPQPEAPKLLLVSTGSVEANRALGFGSPVLLDEGHGAGRAYSANGTPMGVLVDPDGKIASELVAGGPAVMALATGQELAPPEPAESDQEPEPLAIGEAAPEVALPDLAGSTVKLADLRDSRTLVLFWDPKCGYCQRMLPDLKAWEAKPPKQAPRLLVVSTGSADENRAMGLRSTIVLDQAFRVGSQFGADGTPSAVVVDEQGKIASDLAVGGPEVLKLAQGRKAGLFGAFRS